MSDANEPDPVHRGLIRVGVFVSIERRDRSRRSGFNTTEDLTEPGSRLGCFGKRPYRTKIIRSTSTHARYLCLVTILDFVFWLVRGTPGMCKISITADNHSIPAAPSVVSCKINTMSEQAGHPMVDVLLLRIPSFFAECSLLHTVLQ